MSTEDQFFDPETINLMRTALENAWEQLEHDMQQRTSKVALAERILRAASDGERDPARLRAVALTAMVQGSSAPKSRLRTALVQRFHFPSPGRAAPR